MTPYFLTNMGFIKFGIQVMKILLLVLNHYLLVNFKLLNIINSRAKKTVMIVVIKTNKEINF